MTHIAVPCFPRASAIRPSWLYESFRMANERERDGSSEPLIKLHVGEPAFAPPESVGRELAAAALDGRTRYVDVQGLIALRERISDKLAAVNGIGVDPGQLFVTPGSCQGLAALMRSLAEPGAEILMPEIHWPVHLQQALLAGLRPVFYGLDKSYAPDPDSIREVAGPSTRILLLNTPSNPAGAVADPALQQRLHAVAAESGWQVISDEAYEDFSFDLPHTSIGALEQDAPVDSRIVNSVFTFSKGPAMTGYRLGYVAVSRPAVADAMRMVQESNIIAPSAPIQYAGIAALEARDALVDNHDFVRANRDSVLPALVDAGLLRTLPGGGWYVMADVSETGLTGEEFAAELVRRHHVVVVPGSGFSARPEFATDGSLRPMHSGGVAAGLVRVAFCVERDQLVTGVDRILKLVHDLKGERGLS